MKSSYPRSAFTLVEALIALAIVAIISVVAAPSLLGWRNQGDLNSTAQQMIASLREMQSNSATQRQGSQWGIRFSNSTATAPFFETFKGSSYASGTVFGHYRLPATVGFASSTVSAGSSTDVIFFQISGAAAASATITIYILSQPSLSSTIQVDASGRTY